MSRCPHCGAALRECCDSAVSQPHQSKCPKNAAERHKFRSVSRETSLDALKHLDPSSEASAYLAAYEYAVMNDHQDPAAYARTYVHRLDRYVGRDDD